MRGRASGSEENPSAESVGRSQESAEVSGGAVEKTCGGTTFSPPKGEGSLWLGVEELLQVSEPVKFGRRLVRPECRQKSVGVECLLTNFCKSFCKFCKSF